MGHLPHNDDFVMHVETGTIAKVARRRVSNALDRWLDAGGTLFPPQARQAIEHCQRLWEAMPQLGRLTASYAPPSARSSVAYEDRFTTRALGELTEIESWFPADQWRVFERVARDGHSAGDAGAGLDDNTGKRIALAKALVGSIACQIASRKGWVTPP